MFAPISRPTDPAVWLKNLASGWRSASSAAMNRGRARLQPCRPEPLKTRALAPVAATPSPSATCHSSPQESRPKRARNARMVRSSRFLREPGPQTRTARPKLGSPLQRPTPSPPQNKNGAAPAFGPAPPNFSLYIQNTKSKGVNRKFPKPYIPPRIINLPENPPPKGLDKIPPETRFIREFRPGGANEPSHRFSAG